MAEDTTHTHSNAPSDQTGEQEPNVPGHRTHNTTGQADTPVNRSEVVQDTAPQHNTPSVRSRELEPSDPGHRTHNRTGQAGRTVNRSQAAQDTAHGTQHAGQAHR